MKFPSKLQIFPSKSYKFPGNEIPKFRIFSMHAHTNTNHFVPILTRHLNTLLIIFVDLADTNGARTACLYYYHSHKNGKTPSRQD